LIFESPIKVARESLKLTVQERNVQRQIHFRGRIRKRPGALMVEYEAATAESRGELTELRRRFTLLSIYQL
jgi:hypothetical protein